MEWEVQWYKPELQGETAQWGQQWALARTASAKPLKEEGALNLQAFSSAPDHLASRWTYEKEGPGQITSVAQEAISLH